MSIELTQDDILNIQLGKIDKTQAIDQLIEALSAKSHDLEEVEGESSALYDRLQTAKTSLNDLKQRVESVLEDIEDISAELGRD
jgi:archaellum component FlaC